MQDPFFFGYGSLVNRATHSYPEAAKATVRGWRRVWMGTNLRRVAFLSVEKDPSAEIEGLIAAVPGADWGALDLRERAYDRQAVQEITHAHPGTPSVEIYQVAEAHRMGAEAEAHPILLSYLDTVLQGFLTEFGEDGVARFFDSTSGWEKAILDDRAAPIYPRATALSAQETGLVDRMLLDRGIEIVGREAFGDWVD